MKRLCLFLAALILLACRPAPAAAAGDPTGAVVVRSVRRASEGALVDVKADWAGGVVDIAQPYGDLGVWNPGGGEGADAFSTHLQIEAYLLVSRALPYRLTLASPPAGDAQAAIVRQLQESGELAGRLIKPADYFISGSRYAPRLVVYDAEDLGGDEYSFLAAYALPYTLHHLPASGGSQEIVRVDAYETGKTTPVRFTFLIGYQDVVPLGERSLRVIDYGLNKDHVNAFAQGEDLVVDVVWNELSFARDERTVLEDNTPNPHIQESQGYYPIELQLFFSDGGGAPLPGFAHVTSLALDTDGEGPVPALDILDASGRLSQAASLFYRIDSPVTPEESGFGRTAYLDEDGSLRLRLNVAQYGALVGAMDAFSLPLLPPGTLMPGEALRPGSESSRFITQQEFAKLLTDPALTPFTAVSALGLRGIPGRNPAYQFALALWKSVPQAAFAPYALWYDALANSRAYDGGKLHVGIDVQGTLYSYDARLLLRSVPRVGAGSLQLPASLTLAVGETRSIAAVLGSPAPDVQGTPVSWSVGNERIASVKRDPDGPLSALVTGVALGTTYLRASLAADGLEQICAVTVLLSGEKAPDLSQAVTYAVQAERLNVRSSPKVDGRNKLGEVRRGDILQVFEVRNDWAKVAWNKGVAYVSLDKGRNLKPE